MIRRVIAAAVVTAALAAGPAPAAGVRLLEDAWLRDPAWPRADEPAPQTGAFAWAAAGTGRLFGLPDLPLSALRVTAGRSGEDVAWSLAAAWQRLGRDLLRADCLEVTAGRVGRWRSRVRATAERQVLAGWPGPVRRRVEAVLGWGWRTPAGGGGCIDVHLALVDETVHDPRHVAPLLRFVLELRPASFALAWDRRGDGTPLLGAEVEMDLSRRVAVSWRYDGGSRSLGWGLVLRRGPLLIRSSHLVHPELGATHRWQLATGVGCLPDAVGR